MLDEKFSHQEFAARGRSSEASGELSKQLEKALAEVALDDLRALGAKVADKLRALGHEIGESEFGCMADGPVGVRFVDASQGAGQHQLRVDFDLVISVGFPGYTDSNGEALSEHSE